MAKKKPVLRLDHSPVDDGRVLQLTCVGAGVGIRVAICSKKMWGCWTHWNPKTGRTVRCTEPTETCPGHIAGMPQRWKGALTVCDPIRMRPFLVDCTKGCAVYLASQLGNDELRGKIVHFQREGTHKQTPLVATIVGAVPDASALPIEQDPMNTLMKIWGIRDN